MSGQVGVYPIMDTPQERTSLPSDLLVIQRLDAGSCCLVETIGCNYTEKNIFNKNNGSKGTVYIIYVFPDCSVHSRMSGPKAQRVAPENLHKSSHKYLLFINTLFNKKNL